jgi:hypothetical protein
MHAISLSGAWHHWREHAASRAPVAQRVAPRELTAAVPEDDPERLGLRAVHWLPLVVPGMAVLLLVCASAIGTLLR